MALSDSVPPVAGGVLARNGYALLMDLDEPAVREVLRSMEGYQIAFLICAVAGVVGAALAVFVTPPRRALRRRRALAAASAGGGD